MALDSNRHFFLRARYNYVPFWEFVVDKRFSARYGLSQIFSLGYLPVLSLWLL